MNFFRKANRINSGNPSDDPQLDLEAREEHNKELARILVQDSFKDRIYIPYKTDKVSIRLYEAYYHPIMQAIFHGAMVINLSLIFFEDPVSFKVLEPYTNFVTEALNIICILTFFSHWLIMFFCSNKSELCKQRFHIVTPLLLTIMLIDVIIYIIMKAALPNSYRIQWSRALRPVLAALFPENFRIRSALDNIKCTLKDILPTFALFIFFLFFFSIIACEIFANAGIRNFDGTPYLTKFFDCLYEIYVLITTSNSPDIILPAYEQNSFYLIIYILVTVFCNWIFMGIVLAHIYNTYKTHLANKVLESTKIKKQKLAEAFDLLKNEDKKLNYEEFRMILKTVYRKMTEDHCHLLFKLMDSTEINALSAKDFVGLTEYADLNFEEFHLKYDTIKRKLATCYSCYMSKGNQIFVRIIRHGYWRGFCESIVVVNIVFIIFSMNTSYEIVVETVFTCFFIIELGLRCFSTGINLFLKDRWNIFDATIVLTAGFGLGLNAILIASGKSFPKPVVRVILMGRILRILKLLFVVRRFKKIINCLFLIIPSLFNYTCIQLSFYYFFVCLGMELFGGYYKQPFNNTYGPRENCGYPGLNDTDFVKLHYCNLNFNSAKNGFLFMLVLTVLNNWHILLTGSTITTTEFAKIFYVLTHWFCVILVMSIVLAFIIDAFTIEMEANNTTYQDIIEGKLTELGLSASVELKKLGLEKYGTESFDLTHEMLEKAFEGDRTRVKLCFRFVDSGARSMESLLKRMFQSDVDNLNLNIKSNLLNSQIKALFSTSTNVVTPTLNK